MHLGGRHATAGSSPVPLGLDRVEDDVGEAAGRHAERRTTSHIERQVRPDELAARANEHRWLGHGTFSVGAGVLSNSDFT